MQTMQKIKVKAISVTKVFLTVTYIVAGTSVVLAGLFYSFRPPPLIDVQATIAFKDIKGQKTELPNFTMQTDGLVKAKTINWNYSSDQPINLAIDSTQSIGLTGNVILEREDSYARVIAVDDKGNEYLVFEASYPQTGSFNFNQVCEETCVLDSTKITSFITEVSNASLKIDQILRLPQEGKLKKEVAIKGIATFQEDLKNSQVEQRIGEINKYNQANRKYWVAGKESRMANLSYAEKKEIFNGHLPALRGFDYYVDGYFDLSVPSSGDLRDQYALTTSSHQEIEPFIFDWRNQHNQDWLTEVREQGQCGSCWAFGAIGTIEPLINLYFNQHLDIDLSEQQLVSCSVEQGCMGGGPGFALEYIEDNGIVDEECFPYTAQEDPCEDICDDWLERTWSINGHTEIDKRTYDNKKALIENGPLSFSYYPWGHVMVLVGIGEITPGLYMLPYTLEIPEDDPLVGKTYWIARNSGANFGDDGYGKFILLEDDISNHTKFIASHYPITTPLNQSYETICLDDDEDGYCWWGINSDKPNSGCPETCNNNDISDCNDSDANVKNCPYDLVCGNHSMFPSGEFFQFGDYDYYAQLGCCGDNFGEYPVEKTCCDNPSDILDLSETYSYINQFGSNGSEDGQFRRPYYVKAKDNLIFVTDYYNHRVQIFQIQEDNSVTFLNKFGSYGTEPGQFRRPWGIDVNEDKIYVVDNKNNRVQIFQIHEDNSVDLLTTFGSYGSGNGKFSLPGGIAVRENKIYVVDRLNHRVQIFQLNEDNTVTFLNKFGSHGSAEGQFNYPEDIEIIEEKLFVVDHGNNRIQIFEIIEDNLVNLISVFSTGEGQPNRPYGIAVNEDKIFVTSIYGNRVKIFQTHENNTYNLIASFGVEGSDEGQFQRPQGIDVNNNKIYVADTENHRVQIYRQEIGLTCV